MYALTIYTPDGKPYKVLPVLANRYELALFTARHATQFNGYGWKITRLSDGINLSYSANYPKSAGN